MKTKINHLLGAVLSVVIINVVSVHAQSPPCAPLPAGLVAWWPGNGNANDVVGGNHGTLVGGVPFAPGLCGSAFDFGGWGNYVVVPENPVLDIGAGSFTMAAWVYKTEEGIFQHF